MYNSAMSKKEIPSLKPPFPECPTCPVFKESLQSEMQNINTVNALLGINPPQTLEEFSALCGVVENRAFVQGLAKIKDESYIGSEIHFRSVDPVNGDTPKDCPQLPENQTAET